MRPTAIRALVFALASIAVASTAVAEPAPTRVYVRDGECGQLQGGDEHTIRVPADDDWRPVTDADMVTAEACSPVLAALLGDDNSVDAATRCAELAAADPATKGFIGGQALCEAAGLRWVGDIPADAKPGPAKQGFWQCSALPALPRGAPPANLAVLMSVVVAVWCLRRARAPTSAS